MPNESHPVGRRTQALRTFDIQLIESSVQSRIRPGNPIHNALVPIKVLLLARHGPTQTCRGQLAAKALPRIQYHPLSSNTST